MNKNQNKTVATDQDVTNFVAGLDDPQQREDSQTLIDIMSQVSGEQPVMWGSSIIGFGSMHYKYATGREGDIPKIGFSPRKGKLSLYITYDAAAYKSDLDATGKYKIGKGCIYINRLADVDLVKLTALIQKAYTEDSPYLST